MRKKRHNYTSQEKVAILKRHLIDRVPVSDLCDKYHLQPTVFYRWQKDFFENGAAALEKSSSRHKKAEEKRNGSSNLKQNFKQKMKFSLNCWRST